MIPIENIINILNDLSSVISIPYIRADQQGQHPAYPFFVYKIISANIESAHQNIRETEENSLDSTSVDIKTYSRSDAMISLNFLDQSRIDRITPAVSNAFNYFKSITAREIAKANKITIQIISPFVEDRTVYQDAFFENRMGFDIRFDYTGLYTQTIESVETITIESEIDGESKPDIIITA